MRLSLKAFFLAALIGLPGCVLSLNGLYEDEKDLVFDPALIGTWLSTEKDEPNEVWEFQKIGDRTAYKLLYTDREGHVGIFEVGMVKIGEKRFLDLYPNPEVLAVPKDAKQQLSDFYKFHIQGMHSFIRIDQLGTTITLAAPDLDKWKKWIQEHPDAIAHGAMNKTNPDSAKLILTASTPEVRKFISGPMDKPEFWNEIKMTRKQTPATAPAEHN